MSNCQAWATLGKPTHHAGPAPWPPKPRKWGRRQIPGFADKPMGTNGFYEKSWVYTVVLFTHTYCILHTYIYIYIYICVYIYIYVCVYIFICVCVYIYIARSPLGVQCVTWVPPFYSDKMFFLGGLALYKMGVPR